MRIAVVGGGLGGLAAARALVAAGHDAIVLDAAPRPGGVLGTSHVDGFVREHAASSFVGGPPRGAVALCGELGVAVERAAKAAKRRWIYVDGKLRELPRDPIALARSDLLTWRGKLDLLREPLRPPRAGDGDESVHAFAARRLGAEAARAIVAPFVTGVFAADSHAISIEAGFPRLAALDAAGGLVRGALANAAKGALARLRGRAPATTPRGMYAPVGGLGALADALARALAGRVRAGVRVRALAPANGGVDVDGERFDGAVLAVPAEDGAALVGGAMPELASRLAGFTRAPVAIAYLGLPVDAVPRAHDGFGFLVAHGEDVRVLGVVFESTVWPGRAPAGQALLRCIFGGGRDPDAARLAPDELVALARRDVATVLDANAPPTHASVIVHARGIAQYRVGHRERVRDAVAIARGLRVALAGADYRGHAVNDLCADADAIVAEVAAWA
jgi:oxygen-dependent protoporphyrinogen oxidase